VAHDYRIAKNETTIGQYTEFLNAKAKTDIYGLYHTSMTTSYIAGIARSGSAGNYQYSVIGGSASKPITYISWFDAARFCNWLHNGQGGGSTETGAYTLNGAMSGIHIKNAGATTWIPTENEWYKAAYYDPTKDGTGGYWLYPNQSNTINGNTIGVAGAANYDDGDFVGFPGMALTDVGAYGANSDSYYGTNDQAGNVYEWNDAVIGSSRGLRGGSWYYNDGYLLSSYRDTNITANGLFVMGFRVASVPEPSALILMLSASWVWVTRWKR
jgi:formylglycine-generating enzyme required for sulfatase activity